MNKFVSPRSTADSGKFRRLAIVPAAWMLAVMMFACSTADACPYCQSQIGQQVAHELFGDQFWINALMTLAPVPILISIVAIIHFGGIAMLWRAVRRPEVPLSTKTLIGSMALGWGLFNLVEGIIDHHLLQIHHVVEADNHLIYDLAFLASGVALIVIGGLLIRSGGRDVERAV